MDKLPDLVKSALTAACNSGKALSWKVQESDKGILIQLVWKPRLESSLVASESQDTVCSNWNTIGRHLALPGSASKVMSADELLDMDDSSSYVTIHLEFY